MSEESHERRESHERKELPVPKKNPKRVAAGKKGAEAKKIKAELKRKEEELLKKENIELKITKDDNDSYRMSEELKRKENIELKDDNHRREENVLKTRDHMSERNDKNYFQLPIISIVVVGLGFLVYNYASKNYVSKKKINIVGLSGGSELPNKVPKEEVTNHMSERNPPVKKEIDPFEFT